MDITQNKVDDLNLDVIITLKQDDFKDKVEKILKDYRKKVNMPGFRKGMVPMDLIKRQYGEAITFEEINKVLGQSLNKFIEEQNLTILAQPLPKSENKIDLKAEELSFTFEIGLAPEFDVDLSKVKIPYYNIEATDKEINDSVERIQNQFGEDIPVDIIAEGGAFSAKVEQTNLEEGGINTTLKVVADDLKSAEFVGKKVEDTVELKAQELFKDAHNLQHYLGLSHDEAHHFNGDLKFTIEEITTKNKAELNQELFDKIYGENNITSEEDLRKKIKEEIENYYKRESDNYFMNTSVEWLLENIKFDLPSKFLTKYIQSTAKEPISDKQAEEEFSKSEKTLRYQLIEGKVLSDNNISVQFEDLMEYTKVQMRNQFLMYGYKEIPEDDLQNYAENALKEEAQVRRVSGEVLQQKLFDIFNTKIDKKEENISLEKFDEIIKQNQENKSEK